MASILDLQRDVLSWDINASLKSFAWDGSIDSKHDHPCTPLPDRFLESVEYLDAFRKPAILEFKASVLNTIATDTITPHPVSFHQNREDSHQKRARTDFVEVVAKFTQTQPGDGRAGKEAVVVSADTLCAISTSRSLSNPPCWLALSLPGRIPGGVRLRMLHSTSSSLADSMSFFLHPITSMTSSNREFEALCSIDSLPLKEEILLGIASALPSTGSARADLFPIPPPLMETFGRKLNEAQRNVIEALCERNPAPRVVLVRGPPGSGKTLTLNAILNAIHVQQYNAYYTSIAAAVKMGKITAQERSWLDLTRVAKPRIIVCAPSNVAIDNIILRIQSEQFFDGSSRQYVPWLVRIGKGSMQNAQVAERALSRLVEKLTSKTGKQIVERISKLESLYSEYRHGVLVQVTKLNCMRAGTPHQFRAGIETRVMANNAGLFVPYWIDHTNETSSADKVPPPAKADEEPGPPVDDMQEWGLYAKELMRFLELWEETHWKLQRYRLVLTYIQESIGTGGPNSSASMAEKYQLHHNLETLFMNQASVVCGTLNSTGLSQVRESSPFQTCVVDEAAQAVELSTLIPLRLGVKQLVLVGDPQQLPATVLGKRELLGNYERSLFERLETCGVPIHTLNVQYRMHPAISHFPRTVFYQGILQDASSVGQELPFFAKRPYNLNPFMFVDLLSSKDQISQLTQSRSNTDEAAACVSLYYALLRIAQQEGYPLAGKVAVISPYSEQVRVLKQTFDAAGVKAAGNIDDIEIATVDSFQGKEKDIVILSTVRACPDTNSVGFLADMRRMNVALTRAKIGLFVVGKSQALTVNPHWALLIDQARRVKRGYLQVRGAGEDVFGLLSASFFSPVNRT